MQVRTLLADLPAARVLVICLVCGVFLFFSIGSYVDNVPTYNSDIASLAIIFCTGFSLWQLKDAKPIYFSSQAKLILAAIALSFLLSTWLSDFQDAAWGRLKLYYACALLGLFLFVCCRDQAKRLLAPILLVISSIHIIYFSELLFSVYNQPARLELPVTSLHYFGNIRHFGYTGFFSACAAVGMFFLSKNLRMTGYLFSVLTLYGIIQFGSRGALLAWLLFVVSVLCIIPSRKRFVVECATVLLLAGSAVYLVNTTYPMPDQNFASFFERRARGDEVFGSDSGRMLIWQQSSKKIAERPVLGYGPDGYLFSRCCSKNTVQPHSAIVQGLFEFGFIGFSLCLVAVIFFCKAPLQKLRKGMVAGYPDAELTVLMSLLGAFIAFSLIDGLLYHAIPLMHFTILMSVLAGLAYPRRPIDQQ